MRVGHRLEILDSPGSRPHQIGKAHSQHRWHAIAWPLIISLFTGVILVNACWGHLVSLVPALEAYQSRLDQTTPTVLAFALGLLLLHVTGLLDDRRGHRRWPSFSFSWRSPPLWLSGSMSGCAAVGDSLGMGSMPSIIITVVWIVIITNAVNFMDNMDGLAGGVSAIAGSFLMAAAILNEQWFIAATLAVLIGSILGFVYNINPAKIFMGDGGS